MAAPINFRLGASSAKTRSVSNKWRKSGNTCGATSPTVELQWEGGRPLRHRANLYRIRRGSKENGKRLRFLMKRFLKRK